MGNLCFICSFSTIQKICHFFPELARVLQNGKIGDQVQPCLIIWSTIALNSVIFVSLKDEIVVNYCYRHIKEKSGSFIHLYIQFTTSSRRLDGGAYCGASVGGKCIFMG